MRRHLFASLAFACPDRRCSRRPPARWLRPRRRRPPPNAPLLDVKARRQRPARSLPRCPSPTPTAISGRYIYLTQLETGLGSAPVGLDKSLASAMPASSSSAGVGKKVAAEIENPKFVAGSGTADEQKAVRDSFATSTIWMGDVVDNKPDGSFTVDLAGFLARDDLGVPQAIKAAAAAATSSSCPN